MHRRCSQQPLPLSFGVVLFIQWSSVDVIDDGLGGDGGLGCPRIVASGSISNPGFLAEVLLQMSCFYEPFYQVMETSALLRSMPMLFMMSTFPTVISLGWVRFDGSGPPKVGQLADHWKKLLI